MNRNIQYLLHLTKIIILPSLISLSLVWLFVYGVQAQGSRNIASASFQPAVAAPIPVSLPPTGQTPAEKNPEPAAILSQDVQGLVLEFSASPPRVEEGESDFGTCQNLFLDGFDNQSEPGAPRLPMSGIWVGVPPEGDIRIEILEQDQVVLEGTYNLCPAPQPILNPGEDPLETIQGFQSNPNPQIYQADVDYPAQPAELSSQGFLRSQRVAAIRFAPVQYNPVRGQLKFTSRLKLRVVFGQIDAQPSSAYVDEGAYEDLLRSLLLNYETARQWRIQPGNLQPSMEGIQSTSAANAPASAPAYKILVDHDAVYTLTYASLQTAGLPVDEIDPRTFRIENQGSEIAIEVSGEGDASFDPGDLILFYGLAPTSKWAIDNVYWLTWGGVDGLRIQTRQSAPSNAFTVPASFTDTVHMERNNTYVPGYPSGPEKERWYWARYTGYVSNGKIFSVTTKSTFTTFDPTSEPVNASLRIRLYGWAGFPQHHTVITINDQLAGNFYWPNIGSYETTLEFPQTALISGTNNLTIHVPVDGGITYDYFYMNWFEIISQRQYKAVDDSLQFQAAPGEWEVQVRNFSTETIDLLDISDPLHPVRITGAEAPLEEGRYKLRFDSNQPVESRYYAFTPANRTAPKSVILDVPSDLHSASNGADYIIISHKDFLSAIQPLADLRSSEGLRVDIVDVQDIYDEFSAGLLDPYAIHDFLAHAYANWQPPAPLYVLLVGDGHYDFKNYLGTNVINHIPPILEDVDRFALKETAADNRFVTVAGDDLLPDMHLGRFPVRTAAETTAIVNKLLTYALPTTGDWVYKTTFVADNADSGGDFPYYSDLIADHDLPAMYWREKLYYTPGVNTEAQIHSALNASMKSGRLLVSFVGHGGYTFWSNFLWDSESVGMTNAGKYYFLVPMTCLEGYYIFPSGNTSLAESFLRVANRGSIGSISPTGLGLANGHDRLERGLFKAFFEDHNAQFGPATTQAKLYMMSVTGNSFQDLVDTYILIGDPAASLPLAALPDLGVKKEGKIINQDPDNLQVQYRFSYTNTGTSIAQGILFSDTLPASLENPVIVASTHPYVQISSDPLQLQLEDLPPGNMGVITLTADVIDDYVGSILNTVEITAANEKTWSSLDNRSISQMTISPPDLRISKNGQIGEINYPDYWLSYVITYTNQGDYTARNILLTDTLPAELQDIAETHSGMPITLKSNMPLVYEIADTPPGLGGVITITGRFPDDSLSQVIDNHVVISSTSEPDDLDLDNQAQVSVTLPRPDLSISKFGDFVDLTDNQFPIIYKIWFTNNGTYTASHVLISDTMPAVLTDVTAVSSGITISQISSDPLQFEILELPVGGSGEITVTASINSFESVSVRNSAEISSLGELTTAVSDNQSESILDLWLYIFDMVFRLN